MIVVLDRNIEVLRYKLTQRDVTVEDVWDYLILQHQPHGEMVSQNLADFVTQEDLAHFWWLHDWWAPVEEKPATLPTPEIIQFCWHFNHMPNAPVVTFDAALKQTYNRCLEHCKTAGLDPNKPGESADERKRRRNRERMAKVRGHLPVPAKVLQHDEALLAQVRGLEAECERLKAAAKDTDELLRLEVKQHQDAMYEASARRRDTAQDFKTRIENLRTEIRSLTTKQ